MLKKLLFLAALLLPAPLYGQAFALAIDPVELIQESPDSATFELRWYYTPNQNWTVAYDYEVFTTTGEMAFSGRTPDKLFRFTLPRVDTDVQYSARVRVARLSPSARTGPWSGDTFTVPARTVEAVYALAAPSTAPIIVPNQPAYQVSEGTLWLEFTPDRVTDVQGLWSKDATGYDTGGHLSIMIDAGRIRARLQDDSTSYEIVGGTVVDSVLNQAAFVFGDNGMQLWLNGVLVGSNPYTGGLENNTRDFAVGALTWDVNATSPPWASPLSGTMEAVEIYNGFYNFSDRWGDVPIPPPGPVDSLEVIRVSSLRVWTDPDSPRVALLQYHLAPGGYRYVNVPLGQTERLMYELYRNGQKVGYSADADGGVYDCSLMPGGECVNGELIPVRPFRYS
jgi:hypothetical protein